MMKIFSLAFVVATMASGVACADDIEDNVLANRGSIAVAARDDAIAVGEVNLRTISIDNSVRQIAIMRDDVKVSSFIAIVGKDNVKTISGDGNGSVGGGISVSAIGAANSISSTVSRGSGGRGGR